MSNLNKISVVDSRQQLAARPIYEQAIYGPIFVQILRLIFYFVIGLVLFAGIIFTVDSIQSFLKKIKDNKRTDIIRRFISEQNSRNKTADALAASIYNCGGTQLLSSTLNRVELMSVSSVIGRIKTTPVTVLSETIETNFNSISKFLKNNMYVSQKIISTVEDMLNLSNNDKALVQKSYVDSLTSLLEVARMLDPNDRLNPKFDRYVEMAEFLDHRQRDLAISN